MQNYLVIKGVTYVLVELPDLKISSCSLCAFESQCKEMIEYPFCKVFGFCSSDDDRKIFIKVL